MSVSLFGIKIKISFKSLAFIVFFILVFEISNVNGILIFFGIVLHELGHIIAINKAGFRVKQIFINFLDIKIIDENSYKKNFITDMFIFSLGPIFNFIFFLIFIMLYTFFSFKWMFDFCLINILLGVFNLMPITLLDGGQILYSFLSLKFDNKKVETLMFIISILTLIFLLAMSFFIIIKTNNFFFLLLTIYLIFMILKK